MDFHFLGTSAGSPTLERNVTALALQADQRKDWYLFDCGEGTQRDVYGLIDWVLAASMLQASACLRNFCTRKADPGSPSESKKSAGPSASVS